MRLPRIGKPRNAPDAHAGLRCVSADEREVSLIRTRASTFRWYAGTRTAKLTAVLVVLALAGATVWWQWAPLSKWADETGHTIAYAVVGKPKPVDVKGLLAAQARLSTQIAAADDDIAAAGVYQSLAAPTKALQQAVNHATTVRKTATDARTLDDAAAALTKAIGTLPAQTAQARAAAAAAAQKAQQAAAAAAAAQAAQQAAAAKAAQQAAAQAAQQSQSDSGSGGGGGSSSSGSGGSSSGGGGSVSSAPQPASTSLTVTCSTSATVTFTASGGGSVSLSPSGPVSVPAGGSVTGTASSTGSVHIGAGWSGSCSD